MNLIPRQCNEIDIDDHQTEELLRYYDDGMQHELRTFMQAVSSWISCHPELTKAHSKFGFPLVHSVKFRLKDKDHVRDKLVRRKKDGKTPPKSKSEFFDTITDLAGVRVLHLHQEQFRDIHACLMKKFQEGDWVLAEDPVANTWDPESVKFFNEVDSNLKTDQRDSLYTSVHYLIRPARKGSLLRCEIQVRTLFEEIWGEVDHGLNYPKPSSYTVCREQIKVLAKLVGAGSRLLDSIFKAAQPE